MQRHFIGDKACGEDYYEFLARQARLGAPCRLHHVMIRGIEGTAIFGNCEDPEDFLARVERIVEVRASAVHGGPRAET
jgi:hypothetical protein